MNTIGERLVQYWRETGTVISAGTTHGTLSDWEHRHGVLLPDDFVDYLRAADGMPDGESDRSLISFWPLACVAAVPASVNARLVVDPADRFYYFADFLIDSHRYAICCRAGERSSGSVAAVAEGHAQHIMSASFAEFVDRYLTPYTGEFGNKVLNLAW